MIFENENTILQKKIQIQTGKNTHIIEFKKITHPLQYCFKLVYLQYKGNIDFCYQKYLYIMDFKV